MRNSTQGMRAAAPAVLQALAAALLFGASTPISKSLLGSIGPFSLAGILYLGAGLGVLPASVRGGSARLRRDPRQLGRLAAAVASGGIAAPVLLLFGLRLAHAASVSLWLTLETVATGFLAWAFFREHMDRRTLFASILVIAGGILLAIPEGASNLRAGGLVAAACLCWGLDNNLTALVGGFTPAQTTLVKGLVAGVINLGLGYLAGERLSPGLPLVAALAVGALSYGLSIVLYISAAQQLGALRSQLLFACSPFLGVLLAWLAFREPMSPFQPLAALPMAAGLYLMLTGRHEHAHTHGVLEHTHGHRHDDGHHEHVHPGLPAWVEHIHPHTHAPVTHSHAHAPDLHHRHGHGSETTSTPRS